MLSRVLQSARSYSVHAPLVLLHLLEADTKGRGQLLLGHASFDAP